MFKDRQYKQSVATKRKYTETAANDADCNRNVANVRIMRCNRDQVPQM